MLSRERMFTVFKQALKHFVDDPSMEKLSVSYKLNDVEVFKRVFNKNDSIKFDRIYSDIQSIQRSYKCM